MKRSPKTLLTIATIVTLSILAAYLYNSRSNSPSDSSTLSFRDAYYERSGTKPPQSTEERTAELMAERAAMNQTVWAQEVAAQEHEQTIVKYWDQMLFPEDDKYAVLAKFPFDSITLDTLGNTIDLEWGIKLTKSGGTGKTLDQKAWRAFLKKAEKEGYAINAVEFHQSTYEENEGEAPVSVFNTLINLENQETSHRWTVNTKLRIEWTDQKDNEGHYIPGALTVYDTNIIERQGTQVFAHHVLKTNINNWSHPIVYDLDQDGLSEILLPGNNLLMHNNGDGTFDDRKLFTAPGVNAQSVSTKPVTATAADFDNDGYVDILYCGALNYTPKDTPTPPGMGLYLFKGEKGGTFPNPAISAVSIPLDLNTPNCLTAGDIDNDGDLDLWLAQYQSPYEYGQMPTPFYDANDSFPSYLLINNGDGTFEEATEAAGLATKRFRRTFAASFVDLDDDHDLDLVVSSDFAGTDIYYNDGSGNFTDVTSSLLEESANFGMGHTFADFNRDESLDFFVIGMASTTMRRLNQMGLFREDHPEFVEMRTRMGYGNRMYMAQSGENFKQPHFNDNIARSGWSWGTTSFDFDSDGDLDIYVANGNHTGNTTKDYCTQYWCHDIYTGGSKPDQAVMELFQDTLSALSVEGYSWDGFQKNHLFMNQENDGFINVGFITNSALINDCRNVISDDFNGDGRPDLIVLSRNKQRIYDSMHLLMNQWPIENNWVGVRLNADSAKTSTIGAVIKVHSKTIGTQIAHVVTGDSYRSQHAAMKHFGVGQEETIDWIEVRWPNGTSQRLESPAINTYHTLAALARELTPSLL